MLTPLVLIGVLAASALPDTRWSRQVYNTRIPLSRERRQFTAGEWIPLTQPCLTCRPLADPADAGASTRVDDIGLTPPRPPVTQQIHNTNFFQDDSSILQAPPPPAFPSRHHQYQDFLQTFSNPSVVQFPGQGFFSQQQNNPFLPQNFLNNPGFLLSNSPSLVPLQNLQPSFLNPQPTADPQAGKKEVKPEKVNEQQQVRLQQPQQIQFQQQQQQPQPQQHHQQLQVQQPQQQIVQQQQVQVPQQQQHGQILHQHHIQPAQQQVLQQPTQIPQVHHHHQQPQPNNNHAQQELTRLELPLPNAPIQFLPQPQMLVLNPSDPFLTPPPVQNVTSLPNLHAPAQEEIQLLYVPVETLRQRGHAPQPQQQPPQKVQQYQTQFGNQQVLVRQQNGHFITQSPSPQPSTTVKQIPIPVTMPTLLLHSLNPSEPPQQFVSLPPRPAISDLPPQEFTTEAQRVVSIQPRPQSTTEQALQYLQNQQAQEQPFTEQPFLKDNELYHFENEKVQPRPSARPHFQQEVKPNRPFYQQELKSTRNQFQQEVKPTRPQFFQQDSSPTRPQFHPPITTTELPTPTTTLAPHQPPLSVYMGTDHGDVRVVDVLRALKDAKTIPVLDNFPRAERPKVFVGPASLIPPQGYGKFELPYLSNIDNNRVERKVERIPFFVAPLNFNPPAGYSKISLPPPHIGSIVVSSEAAMKQNDLQEKGAPGNSIQDDFNFQGVPEVNPELPGLINDLENEKGFVTTTLPETTTLKPRTRRPSNVYRPGLRRPVPNSRFRPSQTTEREQEVEVNQYSRETFAEVEQTTTIPRRGTPGRRYRLKTSTENYPETKQTEEVLIEEKYYTSPEPQRLDTSAESFTKHEEFGTPVGETRVDVPSSSPFPTFQYEQENQFPSSTSKEVQGIFDVSPQPEHGTLTVENNGNSGFFQQLPQFNQQSQVSTEQPISSTQFFEQSQEISSSTQQTTIEDQTEARTTEEDRTTPDQSFEHFDIPKRTSKFVPAVKTAPNPSVVRVKSNIRSRPRGRVSFTTSQYTTPREQLSSESHSHETRNDEPVDDNPVNVETSPQEGQASVTEPETTTRSRFTQFYRGRKPGRTTPSSVPKETTARSTTSFTVRPSRRSTVRTSVSTKRIRRPTTSLSVDSGSEEYQTTEANYGRKRPTYQTSGVSNEIYDERPSPRPSPRKPFFQKQKNVDILEYDVSTPSSTTQQYQSRKDVNVPTEEEVGVSKSEQYPEWNPSESGIDISGIVLTTMPAPSSEAVENSEAEDEKKKQDSGKKAVDPDLQKKGGRRRVRVRVHKRPLDNFETAESQNVGTVSNVLVPPTPAQPNSEPDLYRFSKDTDFDFETSGKFIGTKNRQHVRNITADIIESTNSFSAPGVDNEKEIKELQKVTIAEEEKVMTVTPSTTTSTTETPTEASTEKTEETAKVPDTVTDAVVEETTMAVEETTTDLPEPITTPPSVSKVKQSRIIKTSTSHKVSHETEICYKGKCIKTNSADTDKDLKLLVESANAEDKDQRT